MNKEANPVTKKRGRKGQPGGEGTDALKQGIAQQGQARQKVTVTRFASVSSSLSGAEEGRAIHYFP